MFDRHRPSPRGGRNAKATVAFCWLRSVLNRLPATRCSVRPCDPSNVVRTPPIHVKERDGVTTRSVALSTETLVAEPKVGCSFTARVRRYVACAVRLDSTRPRLRREGASDQVS